MLGNDIIKKRKSEYINQFMKNMLIISYKI